MINLPHEKCYGCRACLNACPKDAISMPEDEYGFTYPKVDYNKCIQCGLCIKACPELNSYTLHTPNQVLALEPISYEVKEKSASGGLASVLSSYIISIGGVVYGCCEENYKSIGHIRVNQLEDLPKLQSSKYVHSDIRLTYKEARQDLITGKTVLFTGTPCQISGLLRFLGKDYENLITMDLVCHGVPPLRMLIQQVESYPEINHLESDKVNVEFRWKEKQFSTDTLQIYFGMRLKYFKDNSEEIILQENPVENAYMRSFLTELSLRENCYSCPYACKERIADITAADFWGLGSIIPSDLNAQSGVSLALINTKKGGKIFEEIKDKFTVHEQSFEQATLRNRCLTRPYNKPYLRSKFLSYYTRYGLVEGMRKLDPIHHLEKNTIIRLLRKNKVGNLGVRVIFKIIRKIKKLK